jgi:hypothetical protein
MLPSSFRRNSFLVERKQEPMKGLLGVVLLCAIGAWGQNCQRGLSPGPRQAKCSCTGAIVSFTICQSAFGSEEGYNDVGGTFFCGSSCAILTGTGCIPGGLKIKASLTLPSEFGREVRRFARESQAVLQTCGASKEAFEAWLTRTNTANHSHSARTVGD